MLRKAFILQQKIIN